MVRAGDAAAIHIGDWSRRRRPDRAVRISRAALQRNLQERLCNRQEGKLAEIGGMAGLFGTGLFRSKPLRDLIVRHVDAPMLAAIAREYQAGRRLYIVTTNLDAQRTTIWDMGKIAASGDPGALDLFRNVLTASASIPEIGRAHV